MDSSLSRIGCLQWLVISCGKCAGSLLTRCAPPFITYMDREIAVGFGLVLNNLPTWIGGQYLRYLFALPIRRLLCLLTINILSLCPVVVCPHLSLSLLLLFFFDLLTNPVAHRQIGYYYLLNSTLSIYSYLQSSHREITGDENEMTSLLDSIPSKTTKDDCLD